MVTKQKEETAILVALRSGQLSEEKMNEHLSELSFLASTLGIRSLARITQRMDAPHSATFVGKGKLMEVKDKLSESKADMVIFDDDLSPSQLRNLEETLDVKIYDRSLLILDIFLYRAKTSQAKSQVELARYQYLLPRLTKMWTHLERQRGGIGTVGGAGEKEIETDRRVIRNHISNLKKKLEKIEKQSATRRKSRGNVVRVALVGYTNAGKSTLMNLFSKADVKAEHRLFATVDSTVRKVVIEQIPFLLSDTVGFIRKLPHHLVESFKSTLAEVMEADILIHVVDFSHPAFEDHIKVVNETLAQIGAREKPIILVFNKIDKLELMNGTKPADLKRLMSDNWMNEADETVFISAVTKFNLGKLRKIIHSRVKKRHYVIFPNYLKNDIN